MSGAKKKKQYVFYSGRYSRVNKAAIIFNHIMMEIEFRELVSKIHAFDMSRDIDGSMISGKELLAIIDKSDVTFTVLTYRPWFRWSRAIAYYSGGKNLFLNSRKLNRSVASIAGSIAHEAIHGYDNFVPEYLGHGSNSPRGKQHTAPYLFGNIVNDYIKDNYIRLYKTVAKQG